MWLTPLEALSGAGDPADEITAYIDRKLEMSRDNPKESRLFAMEIIQGAPMLGDVLSGRLKRLVDEKTAVISGWIASGDLAPVDPHHLLFMIWATTQHYADFEVQIRALTRQHHRHAGALHPRQGGAGAALPERHDAARLSGSPPGGRGSVGGGRLLHRRLRRGGGADDRQGGA